MSQLEGTSRDDVLIGTDVNDFITGHGGNDTLIGQGGKDILDGGSGADTLTGGDSKDHFRIVNHSDSTVSDSDLISDLQNKDRIDLNFFDADITTPEIDHFHLVTAFDGHGAELLLVWDKTNHQTLIEGDVDGNGQADLLIRLEGNHMDFTNFKF